MHSAIRLRNYCCGVRNRMRWFIRLCRPRCLDRQRQGGQNARGCYCKPIGCLPHSPSTEGDGPTLARAGEEFPAHVSHFRGTGGLPEKLGQW